MSQKSRENLATILARLFEGPRGSMSRELAWQLLKLDFGEDDTTRMRELGHLYEKKTISAEEKQELDDYLAAAAMLSLLQAKARRTLKV